jgi:hypothetical protein
MANNARIALSNASFITTTGSSVKEVMRQLTDRENRISNDASVKKKKARAFGAKPAQ